MNEQFGSVNRGEAYRPHAGRFLHLLIPLGIGFMLGMRKGMMRQGMMGHPMGPGKSWENGVPPFFAELHRRAHAASDQPEVTEA
ncbi:MAG TPA: hypothetical protein VF498_09785 [Anaerolineales bacterium]